MTFKVNVKPGTSLSQLRLFYGKPEHCEIGGEELYRTVLLDQESGCSVPRFFRELSSNDFPGELGSGDVISSDGFGVLARGGFSDSQRGHFGSLNPWVFVAVTEGSLSGQDWV